MSRQVRSFDELIQPNNLDYEGPSDIGSPGEDLDPSSESDIGLSLHKSKKRKYDGDTLQQLEEFVTKNPCPSANQKKEMARQLHLQPKQITYWIQNYRTRRKTEFFRSENDALKKEVVKLHAKLKRYEHAFANTICVVCGGPRIAKKCRNYKPQELNVGSNIEKGKPPLDFLEDFQQARKTFLHTKDGQDLVAKLATAAMEELVMMAHAGAPLWISAKDGGHPNQHDILNKVEYLRIFPTNLNLAPTNFWPETLRNSVVVPMDPTKIVQILMNVKQWSTVFGNIVSKARTLVVLAVGDNKNFNKTLHEIAVEFHLLSPVVPVLQHHFVRYCCQYYEDLWVVADAALDEIFQDAIVKSYRRPSGCLIQTLPDGYSKVTWIENAEVDNEDVQNLYLPLIRSGTAFGAKRWVSTLERQCEWLLSSMVTPHDQIGLGVIYDDKGKKCLYNLTRRMMLKFHSDISASTANPWSTPSGGSGSDEIQSMVKVNMEDPGIPKGTIFSTVSSLWHPTSPRDIFGFLQNLQTQHSWDILAKSEVVEEITRIITSPNPGNYISLLRIGGTDSGTAKRLILQESCTNSIESYLVYTKINFFEMRAILSGSDPNSVVLLPSGFAIIPNEAVTKGVEESHGTNTDGTLLTIAMQKGSTSGAKFEEFQ